MQKMAAKCGGGPWEMFCLSGPRMHLFYIMFFFSQKAEMVSFDNFKFHQNQKTKQLRVCFFVLYTVYTYKRQALKIKEARGLEYQRNWVF